LSVPGRFVFTARPFLQAEWSRPAVAANPDFHMRAMIEKEPDHRQVCADPGGTSHRRRRVGPAHELQDLRRFQIVFLNRVQHHGIPVLPTVLVVGVLSRL
jgi:hypothetical protein